VILVDTNLLVYASAPAVPQYGEARSWLDSKLNGPAQVGLPWASLLGFLRVAANSRAFQTPLTFAGAWAQVEVWLSVPNVWIPQPTEAHREVLGGLLAHLGGGPNLIPDAHLAALAIEHGLTLCSADGDFARFPGLKWLNPLL
jgi:toxin-antitoxin system PIN domain toxin